MSSQDLQQDSHSGFAFHAIKHTISPKPHLILSFKRTSASSTPPSPPSHSHSAEAFPTPLLPNTEQPHIIMSLNKEVQLDNLREKLERINSRDSSSSPTRRTQAMKNDLMKRSRSHGSQDEDYDRARRFRKNDSMDSPLASRSNSRSNSIESRGRPLAKTVSVSRGNSFNRSASRSTSIEAGISISRGIDINNSNHKRALTFQNDSIDMEEPASLMENLSLNDHPPTQNGKWGGPSLCSTYSCFKGTDIFKYSY